MSSPVEVKQRTDAVRALPGIPATSEGQTYSGRILSAREERIDERNMALVLILSIRSRIEYRGRVLPHVLALVAEDESELENSIQQFIAAGLKPHEVDP